MKSCKPVIFITILVLSSFPLKAKEPYIFDIYNQFTAVSAASGKCIKPSKKELTSFLANYQMVSTLMLQEIKKRKPKWSDENIGSFIKKGSDKITSGIYALIELEGCTSPKIQRLTKKFYLQSKWKPNM